MKTAAALILLAVAAIGLGACHPCCYGPVFHPVYFHPVYHPFYR